MKYITECPGCGKSLRFPLDKGKIKIRCRCGYEAVIDPDDTTLYKKGRFDLKSEDAAKNKRKEPAKKAGSSLSKDKIIRKLYDLKYSVQNIRHMPDRERYRLLLLIILPLVLLAFILYFFLVMIT